MPYRVLVSELMLQQTQVSRVVTYYAEFLDRFPTLVACRASKAGGGHGGMGWTRVLRAGAEPPSPWQNRSRTAVETRLRCRATLTSFERCPGIGAYTAGAVSSFAYERRAALVDTNVARVLRRVFAPAVDPKSTSGQRKLWALAEGLLPRTGRATWTHNQALMELGALVCTARVAHCGRCPVRPVCRSAKHDVESVA